MNKLEKQFEEFIATGILDKEEFEFAEYELCIVEFDNKMKNSEERK